MNDEGLLEYVAATADSASLAEVFLSFITENFSARDLLPSEDAACRDLLRESMQTYFEVNGLDYPAGKVEPNEPFVSHARQWGRYDSLREIFTGFITARKLKFPEDNTKCRQTVEKGIEVYFEVNQNH